MTYSEFDPLKIFHCCTTDIIIIINFYYYNVMLTSWHTAKCANVLHQVHDNIRAIGYSDPALEGSSVTLECSSPNLVHMGPNITTCMENGEWEPDPREVNCIGEIVRSCHNYITEILNITWL
jgi:hypothetical protein